MKKLVIIIILLISNFSFYGVVNDEGEKVTSIQEIMQSENVIVEENAANEVEEKTEEKTTNETSSQEKIKEQPTEVVEKQEIKNEEIKETPVKKEITTTKKNENTSVNIEKKVEEQKSKQEEKQIEKSKDEITKVETTQDISTQEEKTTVIPKCTEINHMMETGNSGKWFDKKQQAVAFYEKEIKEWEDKWLKDEIDDNTYYKNCPDGYEYWSCPLCQKWTINLYY